MTSINKAEQAARETVAVIPLVMRTLAAELRQTGQLPSQAHFGVLVLLSQRSSCNLSALAEHQSVSLPTMSNTVSKLVEMGWVQRRQSEMDRRQLLIELTPKGMAVLMEIKRLAEARIEALLAPLSPAEQEAILAGLRVLKTVFHNQ